MRLSDREKQVIEDAVHRVDPEAKVWLFGSRTDDRRGGGDIDIAVLSKRISRTERHTIRHEICDHIGQQKIDLVVAPNLEDPMLALAVEQGVPLNEKTGVS
ncbi:MAG: nucleotidyltransferase domain-containing protein [Alkalispirochaeta sp.]